MMRLFPIAGIAGLALALAACGGTKRPPAVTTDAGTAGQGTASYGATQERAEPLDAGPDVQPLESEGARGSELGYGYGAGQGEEGPLADVLFSYDSAALSGEATAQLEAHAAWLGRNPSATVTIEGHCDERGTVEYNLALGEERARAVKDYLVSRGVVEQRLTTVSYGKERPLDPGSGEAAWSRNRRAHFVVGR
jgi:peptidoglycan-associated lipoprotein